MRRPKIEIKLWSKYWGDVPDIRYYVNGIRVPYRLWRRVYRVMQP